MVESTFTAVINGARLRKISRTTLPLNMLDARKANNARFTCRQSLAKASRMLLAQAQSAVVQTSVGGIDGDDGSKTIHLTELLAVVPTSGNNIATKDSRKKARTTRSKSSSTPGPIQMVPAASKTGHTPKVRSLTNESFEERCKRCIGVYFGKRVPDPMDAKGDTAKDPRLRRTCFVCDTRTDYYCFGCRRWLCFSYPKSNETLPKQPKYFTVDTPILSTRGSIQLEDGKLKVVRECGTWTCYHKAHQSGWNMYLSTKSVGVVSADGKKRKHPSGQRAKEKQD